MDLSIDIQGLSGSISFFNKKKKNLSASIIDGEMSSRRSWLGQSIAGRAPLLGDDDHELPRWRQSTAGSPSMAASIIPAPIVQSTYGMRPDSPSATRAAIATISETPSQSRQHDLEADLQFLLDAQAEGLVRGLGNGGGGASSAYDDASSTNGSATPTTYTSRGMNATRARKRTTRKPGLRSARKGIYTTILALSALKDEELHTLDGQIQQAAGSVEQIDLWEDKRKGLQEATEHVYSQEETIRVQRLRQEGEKVQEEIHQVEMQLMELKARHRKLMSQATAIENSVEAKLASYTSSMRLLEEDVQRFLAMTPRGAAAASRKANTQADVGAASIWRLPPKRRTLEMAREYFSSEQESISAQRDAVERERSALTDGAGLWLETIQEVVEFEKRLRSEMSSMSPSRSTSAWEEPPEAGPDARLKALLRDMAKVRESLSKKLQHAQEQSWNLLIAAIGAELDALKKGEEILQGVVGNEAPDGDLLDAEVKDETQNQQQQQQDHSHEEEIRDLDREFRATNPVPASDQMSDDDPDPELLFSRHDPDME